MAAAVGGEIGFARATAAACSAALIAPAGLAAPLLGQLPAVPSPPFVAAAAATAGGCGGWGAAAVAAAGGGDVISGMAPGKTLGIGIDGLFRCIQRGCSSHDAAREMSLHSSRTSTAWTS